MRRPRYRPLWHPWLARVCDWSNPFRSPALLVVLTLTTLQEVGQHDAWYAIAGLLLLNQFCIRLVTWLIGEVAVTLILVADEWRTAFAERGQVVRAKYAHKSSRRPPTYGTSPRIPTSQPEFTRTIRGGAGNDRYWET